MNWSKISAGLLAFIAVSWSIDAAVKPSVLGMPHWLHIIIMLTLGLRIAYWCWLGEVAA